MNIALVTDTFEIGGGLEHLYQIVKGMPGTCFSLFGKGGRGQDKFVSLDNATLFNTGYKPSRILGIHPDLIHFHHFKPLLDFYKNPFFFSPVPTLFTAHGLHIRKHGFKGGWKNQVAGFGRAQVERYLLNRVAAVIAVSQEDTLFLKEKYGLPRVAGITYGLDLKAFSHEPVATGELRRALALPIDRKIFLTIARFDYQKGYDILVKAIELGQEEFRKAQVCFAWVGAGREVTRIRRRVAQAGLSDLVLFLGERTDSYRLMRASDLFVLPSRWEGLPISLIEAAFCNLSAVASDTCGNREIMADSGQGHLFRNEDPHDLYRTLAARLVSNPFTSDRKGPEGGPSRAFRDKYNISTATMKLRECYDHHLKLQGKG